MGDPLHARDLIVEDALQSRGLIVNDETLIEQERELEEVLKRRKSMQGDDASLYGLDSTGSSSSSSSSKNKKGKGRSNHQREDTVLGYDHVDETEVSTSSKSGRWHQHAQNGYGVANEDYEDDDDNSDGYGVGRPANSGYQDRRDKRRSRQPHSGTTPSTSMNQQAYDGISPLSGDAHRSTNHIDELDSHGRVQYREEGRATDRLLDSILARDPMKELEAESATRSKSLTKEEVRAAHWKSIFISCLFVLAWYICSTLISLYNKWMFSPEHYNFGFPLFVTSCHMLVQFSLCSLVLSIFPTLRPRSRPKARDYGTKVVPCGLATGLDIGLSNLSLKTITLSFYTMCKSSVLGFVLIWAFIFRLERPTLPLIGIISIITAGVIMMVSSETQFHLVGMLQVLTASCLSGLRWSLTQILLDKESMGMNNPFATLFWLAPIMGISLAFCSIFIEGWFTIFSSEFFESFERILVTAGVIILPGVIAFTMNVAEFGLIQRTSVVTLSVAGMFKEVFTIFLSTVVFHDELTPINISGLCVAIVGIGLYNYMKYRNYMVIEKKLLENGGSLEPDSHMRNGGAADEDEAEMEALNTSRSRRDHDGGQFQLVGEDDFDSSSDSEDDDNRTVTHNNAIPKRGIDEDGIEHLPPYAETHPNTRSETRQMEEKVNRDPMLLDLDREEEQLEVEMDNARRNNRQNGPTSSQASKANKDDLLFDADGDDDSRSR